MIKKDCPWCHKKITVNGLGTRPAKQNYKWYQFSKSEKVCPYCANPVKPGGKIGLRLLSLIAPLFILTFIEIVTNTTFTSYYYIQEISWVLATIGFFGFLYFFKFKKVEKT